MARLNDTAAIANRPMEAGETHTVSSRKVENGWMVCHSYYNPRTGECRSSEVFSTSPPMVPRPGDGGSGPSPDSGSSLAKAMEYMKGSE